MSQLRAAISGAVALALGAFCAQANDLAEDLKYHGIWQAQMQKVHFVGPLGEQDFALRYREFDNRGFRLTDLETTVIDGERRFAALWVRGRSPNMIIGPMSRTGFRMEMLRYGRGGLRVTDIEVLAEPDGPALVMGVLQDGAKRQVLEVDLDLRALLAADRSRRRVGMSLVDLEVRESATGLRYTALWEAGARSQTISPPVEADEFRVMRAEYAAGGFALTDMETIANRGRTQIIGVWSRDAPAVVVTNDDGTRPFMERGWQQSQAGRSLVDLEMSQAPAWAKGVVFEDAALSAATRVEF
ncbi:MAG: hypothetical protein AAGE76_14420 [Pseudomonadota bacterium]